jgi:high-affinity nickel permease
VEKRNIQYNIRIRAICIFVAVIVTVVDSNELILKKLIVLQLVKKL